MVAHILTARQLPCNEISNETSSKVFACESSNYQVNTEVNANRNTYLNFYSAKEMIYRFLNRNRIIFLPHVIPKFTELELAEKLNITISQLKRIQKSPKSYERLAKHICLPLTKLYCSSELHEVRYE